MVKVNRVSKKNRTSKKQYSKNSKKQYSKNSKKNKMKKSKRRQYTKKVGVTKKIVNASKTLQNMINNLPDENDKFTGNLDKLVDLVKKYILPQSKDTDIKRYLKLIHYYYHYYSTVEGLILTESRKIEYAGSVDSVAFSPDSQYVATGYYDYLRFLDPKTDHRARPAGMMILFLSWRFHPTTSTCRGSTTITSGSLTPRPVRYTSRARRYVARWRFRPTTSMCYGFSRQLPPDHRRQERPGAVQNRARRLCRVGGVFARQPVRRDGFLL